MSVFLGAGVTILALGVIYAGKKSWHAFHRAVGISPGRLPTIEPDSRSTNHDNRFISHHSLTPPTKFTQLPIDKALLEKLPPAALHQLIRIENKADVYWQWRQSLQDKGQILPNTEAEFVVRKLLNERIPAMLHDYHTLIQHEQRLYHLTTSSDHSQIAPPFDPPNHRGDQGHTLLPPVDPLLAASKKASSKKSVLTLLTEGLTMTENRLDALLNQCRESSYQELEVMRRYLDKLNLP